MEFERQQSAGYLINHLGRLMAKSLNMKIEPMGSSTGQFPLLLLLWEEEGLTPTELSRRLDIEKATVTNTLNRMARDGLIIKNRDPKDARSATITLTDKARSLRTGMLNSAIGVNDQAFDSVDPQDIKTFLAVARAMIRNLGDHKT